MPSRPVESETQASDGGVPASTVSAVATGASGVGDDEDVSLDELMMSDSNEPESDEGAADVGSEAPASARQTAASAEPSFERTPPGDDEAAAMADAAAAQEAAAQAAARLASAARTHSEPPAAPAGAGEVARGSVPPAERPSSAPPPARVSAAPPPSDLQDEETEPPPSVELEPSDLEPPSVVTAPAQPDAPLPSFEIPVAERAAAGAHADAHDALAGRTRVTPLTHLSEVGEDDDDAVTHIGLPVVPEGPGEPYAGAGGVDFALAEPDLAGADPALAEARRAATRLVPRLDPAFEASRTRHEVQSTPAAPRPGGIGARVSGWFGKRPSGGAAAALAAAPRRGPAGTLFDTILPPLSLVLFGSGLGAGIIQLVTQPERGARAAGQTQSIQALQEAPVPRAPETLAERAEAGDGDALFKITSMPPGERTSTLTLALERGYQAQKQNEFREFAAAIETPSGLAMPNLTARFLGFATSPETMLQAFSHLLTWSGSTGPDVLYNVWEKAPGGSRAASLAQQLLHSADQRAKATPALLTALDLRSATSCEQYLQVLPAVKRDGDQRCSATLRALKHRDGCGDDGQRDCFPCLREGSLLDEALAAIEGRRPPQL